MSIDTLAAEPDAESAARPRRLAVTWPAVVPAGIYLVLRGAGILAYLAMAAVNHIHVDEHWWHAWDGDWYQEIARHGYLGVDPQMTDANGHRTAQTPMVFFPGYPLLMRLASAVTAGNVTVGGVGVSLVAGVLAAYGVRRLAQRVTGSARAAVIAVALFAAAPMSIVYGMTYPEATLVALAVWGLVAVLERRWLLAGGCALAAGYVSPLGAPVIAVVMAGALVDLVRTVPGWRTGWRHVLCLLAAPAGMLGYLNWVGSHGQSYFAVQRAGWGSHLDGGVDTVRWTALTLFTSDTGVFAALVAVATIAAVVLCVPVVRRTPWPVWLYTVLTVALIVGSAGIEWDRIRLLLSAFPLLLPIAAAWARRPTWRTVLLTATAVAIGLWVSAYSLTVWHFSI